MQAGAGIGRAGTPRHHADAGAAGELAMGLGHHGRIAFMPAGDRLDLRCIVERVEHGEIALTRHAENVVGAVNPELIDEYLSAGAVCHVKAPEPCVVIPYRERAGLVEAGLASGRREDPRNIQSSPRLGKGFSQSDSKRPPDRIDTGNRVPEPPAHVYCHEPVRLGPDWMLCPIEAENLTSFSDYRVMIETFILSFCTY